MANGTPPNNSIIFYCFHVIVLYDDSKIYLFQNKKKKKDVQKDVQHYSDNMSENNNLTK